MREVTPERWQRVNELFKAALERAPAERTAFFSQACGGDEALLREVESLIDSYEQEESFMEQPAVAVAAHSLLRDQSESLVGGMIGHYRIVSLLGEGGMGEVYLAEDTRLGRRVALKLLPSYLSRDEGRLQRFEREARAASSLNHPNVCVIHEVGETEDARHYIVMEYVEGVTLRRQMQGGRMKLAEALDVAIQMASGLAAAHEAGVVHRDIKPENVMLRQDGYVKVLDFGLAKLAERPPTTGSEAATRVLVRTHPGLVMGTVSYMSPEQARGLAVDTRTDIWSLSVMLYEMITGHVPFKGETASDVISLILQKKPPLLAHYAPQTPPELEHIIAKALHKDREERYQTIKDLLLDLKSLRQRLEFKAEMERSVTPDVARRASAKSHLPAEAETVKRRGRAASGSSRTRTGKRRDGRAIESLAVLPLINVSADPNLEYLSDGITESIINSLSQLPKLRVMARSTMFRYKGREVSPQEVGHELGVRAVLMGRVLQLGDRLIIGAELVDATDESQLWGEHYNQTLSDIFAIQEEIARKISENLRLKLAGRERQLLTKRSTENPEAYRAYLKGRYYIWKFPAPDYEKSRDYFQQAIDLDPTYARGYQGLAYYYGYATSLGLFSPSENWPKAEAAVTKALELDDTLADAYNPLAGVQLYYYRDWPAAERSFRRGLELNPNSVDVHNHYANCLYLFGRNEESLAEIQRAVELDPLSLIFNFNLGKILFFIRQYDRAIDQFHKTLELDQNYALAHEWLGYAYEQKGIHKEAIAEWSKALALTGAGAQASSLEGAYAASGFEAAVRALAQQRLENLNERVKRGGYVPAIELVTAYARLDDNEKALTWLAKAVEERNRYAFEIKVNPIYDKLRDEPRFQDLVQRVG